ncbi:MAG: site-2 protease family protein, partial [Erysipelotrichaceae bacterium]
MNILYFVLMMGVIIFVHELGHFITAKSFGVYCHEFALGMGPTVFKKKIGETIYAIRALPVGGFVSMAGEEG